MSSSWALCQSAPPLVSPSRLSAPRRVMSHYSVNVFWPNWHKDPWCRLETGGGHTRCLVGKELRPTEQLYPRNSSGQRPWILEVSPRQASKLAVWGMCKPCTLLGEFSLSLGLMDRSSLSFAPLFISLYTAGSFQWVLSSLICLFVHSWMRTDETWPDIYPKIVQMGSPWSPLRSPWWIQS